MPRKSNVILARPPLLRGECIDDFDDLRDMIERDISPLGIIEAMYVADIACIVWEILRLRRCKVATIHSAYPHALKCIVRELSGRPTEFIRVSSSPNIEIDEEERKINDLAVRWFTDEESRLEVSRLLGNFLLDESAIEARAIRNMSSQLEWLDKMMISLEMRRDRALRQITEYRESFARRLRESAKQIIEVECAEFRRPQNAIPFEAADLRVHHDE